MTQLEDEIFCNSTSANPYVIDPDINGPGVIIGFCLTGILTFILYIFVLWLYRVINSPSWLKAITPIKHRENITAFWIGLLEPFMLTLSDQQLLTAIILLVCAYARYWESARRCGGNNLFVAADIATFSCVSHVLILHCLMPFDRRHRALGTLRVKFLLVYGLLLGIYIRSLTPNTSTIPRPRLTTPLTIFWHAAYVIMALGLLWTYLITYLPIFVPGEAYRAREAIAYGTAIEHVGQITIRTSMQTSYELWIQQEELHARARLRMRFGLWVTRKYLHARKGIHQTFWWCLIETVFPFYCTPILLGIFFAFGMVMLAINIWQTGWDLTWSFGQLLPPFLILLPVQALIRSYALE